MAEIGREDLRHGRLVRRGEVDGPACHFQAAGVIGVE
jgi:hypothetical protein